MTALSCAQILQRLDEPDPRKRLIVSPLLEPSRQLKANQAGIDVRLGRSFALVRPWTQGVAEHLSTRAAAAEPPLEQFVLDFGEPLIIHPHQFVLARTLEYVRLPADLCCYVIGRSSWGRRGLIVATAVVVHPTFAGPITLELKNVGEVPMALYSLDCVAQLVFHPVDDTAVPSGTSQFASSFTPSLGVVRDEQTEAKLRKLIALRSRPS